VRDLQIPTLPEVGDDQGLRRLSRVRTPSTIYPNEIYTHVVSVIKNFDEDNDSDQEFHESEYQIGQT
jgi:hypothetical protein